MTATVNGTRWPSWASHVDDKRAPMPLLLVQAFADTVDHDRGTDMFAHPDQARAWLAEAGLRVPGPRDPDRPGSGFARDLRLAREVRETVRALIGHSGDDEPLTPEDLEPLEEVLSQAQPRLDVGTDGQVRLGPALPTHSLADGLLGLLLIIRDAQADGSWDRLKLCGNPGCRWAFYDRSHSRRGAWCDMATCGNRVKNRNLRARRAQTG